MRFCLFLLLPEILTSFKENMELEMAAAFISVLLLEEG